MRKREKIPCPRNSLFIDTGAFYARYVARDEHHAEAMSRWQAIQRDALPCVTSNFVVAELTTLFVYRFGAERALRATREIYGSQVLRIVPLTLEIELKALDWIERFQGQEFSMTDATSFALMSEQNLKTAFTFDQHFDIAGFCRFQA